MTVGIAAMCLWNGTPMVVGASDRMITSGDIEYEPRLPKIYPLTSSIVMLIAGDTSAQSDIIQMARTDISQRLSTDVSWMSVFEVANIVGTCVVRFHQHVAQRVVLEPYGLTLDTFLTRQKDLHPSHLQQITQQIDGCRPNIEILIAGVDERGSHVYEVQRWGTLRSGDASGFGAIGGGRRHAESEFMFDRHDPFREFPESCLLTYSAKKRAEVAPGVGRETDMFAVLGLGGYTSLKESLVSMVQGLYTKTERIQLAARDDADVQIKKAFQAIVDTALSNATKPAEQESVDLSDAPPNEASPSPKGGDSQPDADSNQAAGAAPTE